MTRKISQVIIHCADTPNGKHFTVEDIDSWHVERGFKRNYSTGLNPELKAIGYHFVIYVDGTVHTGRSVEEIGSHCSGANSDSIGICLIGKDEFTPEQWWSLKTLLEMLQNTYGDVKVKGHYEYPTAVAQGKSCPNFRVNEYMVAQVPLPGHIC